MRQRQLILIIPFILLLVITFIAVANSDVDYVEKQNELVASVEQYREDELYVRVIPAYEEACSYDTEQTPELEKELEEIYQAYGDYDAYIKLVAKRIDKQTAEVQEYIDIADYMRNKSDYTEAMDVIRKGLALFGDDDKLQRYYDEYHYQFIFISGKYREMVPVASGSIPVNNGEGWGYLSSGGKMISGFGYEKITPFSDGFAIAKIDGTWYCINSNLDKWSIDKAGIEDVRQFSAGYARVLRNGKWCFANSEMEYNNTSDDWISKFSNGLAGFERDGKFGFYSTDLSVAIKAEYSAIAVNDFDETFNSNRAFVKKGDSYIMIDTEGKRIGNESFEDAYAFMSGGTMAAVKKDGKWGFVNSDGKIVIDCQYEAAKSFSAIGMAAVSDGEEWGYINTDGKLVIGYMFGDARPFTGISAQVDFQDGWMLIAMLDTVY